MKLHTIFSDANFNTKTKLEKKSLSKVYRRGRLLKDKKKKKKKNLSRHGRKDEKCNKV